MKYEKSKIHGLWITSVTLDPILHGNSAYIEYISRNLANNFKLDLLYYPEDKQAIELKKLNYFKNIYHLKREPNILGNQGLPQLKGINSYEHFIHKNLIDWLRKNCTFTKYKFVICDYIYLSKIFDVLPEKILKILNVHDIYGDRHIKLGWDEEKKKRFFCCNNIDEIICLKKSDILISINSSEKKELTKKIKPIKRNIKIQTVNYCPKILKINKKNVKNEEILKIGFIGSNNPINCIGINNFIDNLSGINFKNIELHIVGLVCDKIDSEYSWIKKHFIIPEGKLVDFYESIDLFINPMPKNTTGLKIKTVVALLNSTPIIGTKDAFTGIKTFDRWHQIDSIENLANEVHKVANNHKFIDQIRISSDKLGNLFKVQSNNQVSDLVNLIKKELFYKKYSLKNYKFTLLSNLKKNEKLDITKESVDYFERAKSITTLSETIRVFNNKLNQFSNIKEQLDEIIERNQKLRDNNQNLRKELNEIIQRNKEIKDNNQNLRKELNEIIERNQKLKNENKNLENQVDKFKYQTLPSTKPIKKLFTYLNKNIFRN